MFKSENVVEDEDVVELSILRNKEHFWRNIITFWWKMVTFEGPQCKWTNPGRGQTPPIQTMPVFWEQMVMQPLPNSDYEIWPFFGTPCALFIPPTVPTVWKLVLKTFKKLSSERVPSECSKSRYIGELYLLTPKIPSERVPSECSQRRYIGELYLLSKKPPQIRIVNGHRENNSFINAALPWFR